MLEGEQRLIRQAQKGQSDFFGLLYDHYCQQIYRFIFLKVSNKEEAEDLTHEVFLSAWRNIGNYNSRGYPFSSWLYRIARNQVIDHYRTKKDHSSLENENEAAFQIKPALESDLDRQTELTRVDKAIALLGEEQQTVVILRYIEEMSSTEIATVLGKSGGAVRLIQHRAIKKIKEILNEQPI